MSDKSRPPGEPPPGEDSCGTTKRVAAEALIRRAMGEEESNRRARLARRAIPLDDSLPDAWGILGEAEEDDEEAVRLFTEVYRLAEASLGEPACKAIRDERREDPARRLILLANPSSRARTRF